MGFTGREMWKCMQQGLKRLWSTWIFSQCGIRQMCEAGMTFKIIRPEMLILACLPKRCQGKGYFYLAFKKGADHEYGEGFVVWLFFFSVENSKKIFCFGKLEVDYLD